MSDELIDLIEAYGRNTAHSLTDPAGDMREAHRTEAARKFARIKELLAAREAKPIERQEWTIEYPELAGGAPIFRLNGEIVESFPVGAGGEGGKRIMSIVTGGGGGGGGIVEIPKTLTGDVTVTCGGGPGGNEGTKVVICPECGGCAKTTDAIQHAETCKHCKPAAPFTYPSGGSPQSPAPLTYRQQIAMRVLAGFAADSTIDSGTIARLAEYAWRWADALIAAEGGKS